MKNQGIVFFVVVFLMACQTNTILPPEPKEHDKWTYRFTHYDTLGNVIGSYTRSYTAIGFLKPVAPNTLAPYVCVRPDTVWNYNYGNFPHGDYRMEPDGLHFLTMMQLGGVTQLFLKCPGVAGENYSIDPVEANINSVNDTLTVPFGFMSDLYKYEFSYEGTHVRTIWFNDSVWFVKSEEMNMQGDIVLSCELVDYEAH